MTIIAPYCAITIKSQSEEWDVIRIDITDQIVSLGQLVIALDPRDDGDLLEEEIQQDIEIRSRQPGFLLYPRAVIRDLGEEKFGSKQAGIFRDDDLPCPAISNQRGKEDIGIDDEILAGPSPGNGRRYRL